MSKLRALFELTRFSRPLMATVYFLVGAYLGSDPPTWPPPPAVAVGAAVVLLITAFSFVVNDFCDSEVDAVGRPQRPIPSGRVSRREAAIFAALLAAAALAVSLALAPRLRWIALAMIALGAAYSLWCKGTLLLGNLSIAVLNALLLIFGALAAGRLTAAAGFGSLLASLYILAQEILFNVQDQDPDGRAGMRTTAGRLGRRRSLALVRAILATLCLVTLLPAWLGWARPLYPAAWLAGIALPVGLLILMLSRSVNQPAIDRAAGLSRLVWLTGIAPLALLK